jgi:hypothetical protein
LKEPAIEIHVNVADPFSTSAVNFKISVFDVATSTVLVAEEFAIVISELSANSSFNVLIFSALTLLD